MNILFITSDQHRGDCYGFEGRNVQTPHLDALASEGTRFEACITPNALCQPARASILTGLYPRTHGVVDNGYDLAERWGEAGFSGQLAQAGYDTGFIGKAHFSSYNTFSPTGRPECLNSSPSFPDSWRGPYMGFQEVELMVLGHELKEQAAAPKGQHYERWLRRDGRGEAKLEQYGTRLAPDLHALQTWHSALPPAWHHNTWCGDRTVAYLKEHRENPFALWVSFADPHVPFDCPHPWSRMHHPDEVDLPEHWVRDMERRPWWHKAYVENTAGDPGMDAALRDHETALTRLPARNGRARDYQDSEEQLRHTIANYYSMISLIDHNVGRILDSLQQLGLADNTLVVFSSDHGDWLGDHGMMLKGPLMYEGLLRVGLIVRGPGVGKNRINPHPVATTDLPATFLDYAAVPTGAPLHGKSLRGLLEGDEASRDFAYNEWDLNPEGWGLDLKLRTVRTRRHKLTLEENSGAGELYDLGEDPQEMDNVFDTQSYAAVRRELTDMIRSRPDDVMDPVPPPAGIH